MDNAIQLRTVRVSAGQADCLYRRGEVRDHWPVPRSEPALRNAATARGERRPSTTVGPGRFHSMDGQAPRSIPRPICDFSFRDLDSKIRHSNTGGRAAPGLKVCQGTTPRARQPICRPLHGTPCMSPHAAHFASFLCRHTSLAARGTLFWLSRFLHRSRMTRSVLVSGGAGGRTFRPSRFDLVGFASAQICECRTFSAGLDPHQR